MAELKKMQDYEYDLPELVDQPEQQMPDLLRIKKSFFHNHRQND